MAIRKHPDLYGKFVWSNAVSFFFSNMDFQYDFYAAVKERVLAGLTGPAPDDGIPGEKGPQVPAMPPRIRIASVGHGPEVVLTQNYLTRLHLVWEAKHSKYFMSRNWIWAYLAILSLSVVQLIRFRGRHLGAFLVFVLSLVPLGAGVLIALVEIALSRYSCPTRFVFYLSVAMAPFIWISLGQHPKDDAGVGGTQQESDQTVSI